MACNYYRVSSAQSRYRNYTTGWRISPIAHDLLHGLRQQGRQKSGNRDRPVEECHRDVPTLRLGIEGLQWVHSFLALPCLEDLKAHAIGTPE